MTYEQTVGREGNYPQEECSRLLLNRLARASAGQIQAVRLLCLDLSSREPADEDGALVSLLRHVLHRLPRSRRRQSHER